MLNTHVHTRLIAQPSFNTKIGSTACLLDVLAMLNTVRLMSHTFPNGSLFMVIVDWSSQYVD